MRYREDTLIYFRGTIDETDGSAITVASGGSGVARLFDDRKDTWLRTAAGATQTNLQVEHTRGNGHGFEVGDNLRIELDSGAYHESDIVSIDHAARTITITAGLASQATVGKPVAVLLGSSITLSEFGTPVVPPVPKAPWGWRGLIADTHPDLEIGAVVRVEIELNGGADLQARRRIIDTVEGRA